MSGVMVGLGVLTQRAGVGLCERSEVPPDVLALTLPFSLSCDS